MMLYIAFSVGYFIFGTLFFLKLKEGTDESKKATVESVKQTKLLVEIRDELQKKKHLGME